jgi:DNA-binding PadR family transcriptional regulator
MKAHSQLGYALLGLIHQQPLSGYDVKKIFASTPMAGFSDSPGAIYPALRRLEQLGLVRSEVQQITGLLRRRRAFEIAAKGVASLRAWQSKPIVEQNMVRGMSELLLRFAFMDEMLGRSDRSRFCRSLRGSCLSISLLCADTWMLIRVR